MKRTKITALFALLALFASVLVAFTGCNTVQETGRTNLVLLSVQEEQQMGAQSYKEILAQSKLSTDKNMNARLDAIAKRIVEAVGSAAAPGTAWEWHVIEDETVNAFALPGGKIAVYSGLMKMASDDELAFVVGHEIAHVTARHGAERMSQQAVLSAVGSVLVGGVKSSNQALFEAAYGLGANLGILLPYSRKNEYEADEIGSLYAARAGYNPQSGITMLQKLKALSGGGASTREWLSTHPLDDNRIAAMQALLPSRMEIYEQNKR